MFHFLRPHLAITPSEREAVKRPVSFD